MCFTDLETCVNLREASSAWYSLFQEMDLKAKLRPRNPWIRPQDDLSSCTDCVLVFVARLRRWQFADSIDKINIPTKLGPRKTVVAVELKREEANFAMSKFSEKTGRGRDWMIYDGGFISLQTLMSSNHW